MEKDGEKLNENESSLGKKRRSLIKEGWCIKESGTTFLRNSNWRRRWFVLVEDDSSLTLSYFKNIDDSQPKGRICLDPTYTARELETNEEKGKAHCFAIGPLFIDPSIRTYYVSCENEEEKLDWMSAINASIEGSPAQVKKHAKSFRKRYNRISGRKVCVRPLSSDGPCNFEDPGWRMQQWQNLCKTAADSSWKKIDTKNGITVARQGFQNNPFAVIKTEGVVPVLPEITLEYLEKAIQLGGKLDYPFRNAKLVQKITDSNPQADIFYSKFDVPVPGISARDCLWLTMKVHPGGARDEMSGMLFVSISQAAEQDKENDYMRIKLGCSGIIICPEELEDNVVHTKVTVLCQIDAQRSLQSMLEGSYKSGLLKIGLRNAFSHIRGNIEDYNNLVSGVS
ncbi:uncharacterized protein LOC114519660 [Dendronephthya gigantea]|uniref:uncharacterized protein LOC114519660 n=1 Tax=Dendronephthya gigantea TaxID=151771 RepID=UPI00106DA812|nr:uncharacterized protein LOC114519660 [Dendronephthya gigantea]